MARKRRSAGNLELIGGQLCLDFANTFTRTETLNHEYLHSYADLIDWSQHARLLSVAEAEHLRQQAVQSPTEAAATFNRSLVLRETIYRLFATVAQQQPPAAEEVAVLNGLLAHAPGYVQIGVTDTGFVRQLIQSTTALDAMLWPIVWSAAELLTSPELRQVRQCARREGCDWLFVDTSKNSSRRWCSMNLCGSRAKAHRYYQRKRRS